MFSFIGTQFCLKLIVLVVCRLCYDVYNFKWEKTMFTIRILILR
jgi:hypothetical protein